MKSLQELEEIRKSALEKIKLRTDENNIRVVVGMATCGIAAGARTVMAAFLEEIKNRNLSNVTVSQTGCIGVCRLEPIVEIYENGKEKISYVNLTPDKVKEIVLKHLVNGNVCTEYTIGSEEI